MKILFLIVCCVPLAMFVAFMLVQANKKSPKQIARERLVKDLRD